MKHSEDCNKLRHPLQALALIVRIFGGTPQLHASDDGKLHFNSLDPHMLWTVETHATCYKKREQAFLSAKPVLSLCYDMAMKDNMTTKSHYSQTLCGKVVIYIYIYKNIPVLWKHIRGPWLYYG